MTADTQEAKFWPEKETAIAEEIRIVQSVQVQNNMPMIVGGSIAIVLIVLAIDWHASVRSHAIYFLILEVLMFAPMLRSYFRLRGRPRPTHVSVRRIQTLEIYSLFLGLVWAAAIFLFMSEMQPVDGTVWLWCGYVMCFSGAFLISSLPRAATAFATPVALVNFYAAFLHDTVATWLLILLCVTGISALARIVWQSWTQTKEMVVLSVEKIHSEAERNRMLETVSTQLGKYMSPQLYHSIFRGEQKVEITAKRKKLTVFFSDIVSFTEITDQMESEELTALLNRYLTEMSNIALGHGATIDKFIGDSIVVYFGDPESQGVKEDANQCVRMAIAMQDRVRELAMEWRDMGLERTFELRIGINTGYCTVGNFGSEERMDYTIIGSEVNLAARLEGAADVGGILLANETYALVKDWLIADEGVPISVKGFSRPVKTFRVKGTKEKTSKVVQKICHDEDGITFAIDLDNMNPARKANAKRALEGALSRLKEFDPPH